MSETPEAVFDDLTGDLTILSRERAHRPNEILDGNGVCAFCPGNERQTPPELDSYRNANGEWLVRAFKNKYPALVPPAGDHEVVVDSRDHLGEITALGVRMWHERYVAALERMPGATPVLFKNSGAAAGATLLHPHTQLLVVRAEIPRWREMRLHAADYAAAYGRCIWCSEIARAGDDGTLVWEDDDFIGYTRPAGRFEGALTIAPRFCAPSWRDVDAAEALALGVHLVRAADALRERSRDFNIALYGQPHVEPEAFHWTVEVIPRGAAIAGLELSAGIFVKSRTAQESADWWRRTLAVLNGPV